MRMTKLKIHFLKTSNFQTINFLKDLLLVFYASNIYALQKHSADCLILILLILRVFAFIPKLLCFYCFRDAFCCKFMPLQYLIYELHVLFLFPLSV